MKSVVLGKVIEKTYFVEPNTETITIDGEEKVVYKAKPVMKEESKIKEWREICHFDGEPRYNSGYWTYSKTLNISENEEVCIDKEIFRADLNVLHLKSNKVVEEIEVDKKEANAELEEHIANFNEMMIESNKLMQDYCDLHHLAHWDSDCEVVFSLVYPGKKYMIKDGKMECEVKNTISIDTNCVNVYDSSAVKVNTCIGTISDCISATTVSSLR